MRQIALTSRKSITPVLRKHQRTKDQRRSRLYSSAAYKLLCRSLLEITDYIYLASKESATPTGTSGIKLLVVCGFADARSRTRIGLPMCLDSTQRSFFWVIDNIPSTSSFRHHSRTSDTSNYRAQRASSIQAATILIFWDNRKGRNNRWTCQVDVVWCVLIIQSWQSNHATSWAHTYPYLGSRLRQREWEAWKVVVGLWSVISCTWTYRD